MFTRICPECDKVIQHKQKSHCTDAIRRARVCRNCNKGLFKKGCISIFKGHQHSAETINKLRINSTGKQYALGPHNMSIANRKKLGDRYRGKLSPWSNKIVPKHIKDKISETTLRAMMRPEVRTNFIKAMNNTPWLKVRCDKGQLEMLEKWNRLGFKFEPNYQFNDGYHLYYLDGYDREHNVVFEYDSKYHSKRVKQDLLRQQHIVDVLKPKAFWRYNAVTQQFNNVIKECI